MTSPLTARDLFVSVDAAGVAAGLRLPPVPEGVSSLISGFEWRNLGERVFDLLDLNIVDILIGGWSTYHEVQAQLRATRDEPGRTVLVQLAHHTLASSHASSIELRAQGRKVLELSFPIELAFEIDAAELTLRGGRVREIRAGDVQARGTVKLENTVILERKLSPLRLPGRIVVEEPQSAEPAPQIAVK
jgi:hypothetical protein